MKRFFILILLLALVLVSCNNNVAEELTATQQVESYTEIQNDLSALNESYVQNQDGTRSIWGFFRKLIVGCVDAVGYVATWSVDVFCNHLQRQSAI